LGSLVHSNRGRKRNEIQKTLKERTAVLEEQRGKKSPCVLVSNDKTQHAPRRKARNDKERKEGEKLQSNSPSEKQSGGFDSG